MSGCADQKGRDPLVDGRTIHHRSGLRDLPELPLRSPAGFGLAKASAFARIARRMMSRSRGARVASDARGHKRSRSLKLDPSIVDR
jgi:hypothetical protein